jgi:hypothetical protein
MKLNLDTLSLRIKDGQIEISSANNINIELDNDLSENIENILQANFLTNIFIREVANVKTIMFSKYSAELHMSFYVVYAADDVLIAGASRSEKLDDNWYLQIVGEV